MWNLADILQKITTIVNKSKIGGVSPVLLCHAMM